MLSMCGTKKTSHSTVPCLSFLCIPVLALVLVLPAPVCQVCDVSWPWICVCNIRAAYPLVLLWLASTFPPHCLQNSFWFGLSLLQPQQILSVIIGERFYLAFSSIAKVLRMWLQKESTLENMRRQTWKCAWVYHHLQHMLGRSNIQKFCCFALHPFLRSLSNMLKSYSWTHELGVFNEAVLYVVKWT